VATAKRAIIAQLECENGRNEEQHTEAAEYNQRLSPRAKRSAALGQITGGGPRRNFPNRWR